MDGTTTMALELLTPIVHQTTRGSQFDFNFKCDTVEPLIEDTLNKGNNLRIMNCLSNLDSPHLEVVATFLTSEEWILLYNRQK